MDADLDSRARARAFSFLRELSARYGDVLPWRPLLQGFEIDGRRVPLLSQQGIFKPAACRFPLSIRTTPEIEGRPRPYDDVIVGDGLLAYSYRGTDPRHWQNVGLRELGRHRRPLVYFVGVSKGRYVPLWPVFIEQDEPERLRFLIRIDAANLLVTAPAADALADAVTPRYATRVVEHRLHQARFRVEVLHAYRDRCAICRLRHAELLDAAHIREDRFGGAPVVSNGLSLCRLHHAAFDSHILGIRPDLVIELRPDLATEEDGPMLRHGLQGFAGETIEVPRRAELRPDERALEERYERFRETG